MNKKRCIAREKMYHRCAEDIEVIRRVITQGRCVVQDEGYHLAFAALRCGIMLTEGVTEAAREVASVEVAEVEVEVVVNARTLDTRLTGEKAS